MPQVITKASNKSFTAIVANRVQSIGLHFLLWFRTTSKPLRPTLYVLALFCLAGCINTASRPGTPTTPESAASQEPAPVALTQEQAKAKIQSLRQLAEQEELDLYAPQAYQQAQDCLERAASAEGSIDLIQLESAETLIMSGLLHKQQLQNRSPELKQLKERLDSLDSQALFPEEYRQVTARLTELSGHLEQHREAPIIPQQELQLRMTKLLKRVLHQRYLADAEARLQRAQANNAAQLTPVSYAEADFAMQRALDSIEQSPGDIGQVQSLSLIAEQRSKHLSRIFSDAQKLKNNSASEIEQHLLNVERMFERIAGALNQTDIDYLPLNNQSILLAQVAETLKRKKNIQDSWLAQQNKLPIEERDRLLSEINRLTNEVRLLSKQLGERDGSLVRQTDAPLPWLTQDQ